MLSKDTALVRLFLVFLFLLFLILFSLILSSVFLVGSYLEAPLVSDERFKSRGKRRSSEILKVSLISIVN